MEEKLTWEAVILPFLDWCGERGCKDSSIECYNTDVKQAQEYFAARAIGPAELTADNITSFLDHLEAKGLATSSQKRKLATLRVLGEYIVSLRLREDNPGNVLRFKGVNQVKPHYLAEAELRRLVDTLASGTRERCVVELMALGLGTEEIVRLRWSQVDVDGGIIRFGDRKVFVAEACARELAVYMREVYPKLKRETRGNQADIVFRNYAGRGLTRQCLWKMVNGMSEGLNPQTIRRSAIIHMLARGMAAAEVAQQTGHLAPDSLARYARMAQHAERKGA